MPTNTFSFGDEQVKFYDENGYVVVDNVISPEECDRALAVYEKYAKPDHRGIMNMDRGRIEYRETGDGEEQVEEVAVDTADAKTIWDMMAHPRIVSMLEALQHSEVVALQSMLLFKRAGSPYATQAWNPHQDNAYPQAPWGMYITGNIPFADQDSENGGMYIFPGSHREPILPNVKVSSFHEKAGESPGHKVEVPAKYLAKKTDLYMKKGSVLFLHGNVIHGSYPNNSSRSRPMLLIPYGTKGITSAPGFLAGRTGKRMEMPLK